MDVIACPNCHTNLLLDVVVKPRSSSESPSWRVPAELVERVRAFLRTVKPGKYTYAELAAAYVAGGNPEESQYHLGGAFKAAGVVQTRDSKARYYTISAAIGKRPEPVQVWGECPPGELRGPREPSTTAPYVRVTEPADDVEDLRPPWETGDTPFKDIP